MRNFLHRVQNQLIIEVKLEVKMMKRKKKSASKKVVKKKEKKQERCCRQASKGDKASKVAKLKRLSGKNPKKKKRFLFWKR